MTKAKKLIEVAMPIKEISAESKRDKSLRHGHISTLQYWLARRPLPVCRAVIFASLVPDPEDENCPSAFKEAVHIMLQNDQRYTPYKDIPYTAIYDPMTDDLRNRLLMFIGKFSPICQENMSKGKSTSSKDQINEGSLIKWESKNDKEVLTKARKLIWVAYNAEQNPNISFTTLSHSFDVTYKAIEEAENNLYASVNRHQETDTIKEREIALQVAIDRFQSQMPSVFDPFAGGGAIPLEAARLGCRSFGNDINPVAHIIEKGSLEYPQKYGKPIKYTEEEFLQIYGNRGRKDYLEQGGQIYDGIIYIPNRLSFDVAYYSKILLEEAEKRVNHLYPKNKNGEKPCAYYWVRFGTCSNPSCQRAVPLLKSFILSSKKGNEHSIFPIIEQGILSLRIGKGLNKEKGWYKSSLTCPFCGAITSSQILKEQSNKNLLKPELIALIYNTPKGKRFEAVDKYNKNILNNIQPYPNKPIEKMHPNSGGGDTFCWGINHYSQLFLERQLYAINALIESFEQLKKEMKDTPYHRAIYIYLALLINRVTPRSNMFVLLNTIGEKLEHIYRNQAIPMVFDFPESGVFCTAMGGAYNQIEWIIKYIESESHSPFSSICCKTSSGDVSQFPYKSLDAVITDPPYYDAMAYADFSDFFYLWFRKMLSDIMPEILATPQTPKIDECTAIKHYHNNSIDKAKEHFEKMLTSIFRAIEYQTSGIISIMFAHQSTEAWSTLCNAIISANMNINGSWAIDSERSNAGIKTDKAFLESSVTVACRPSERSGYGSFKQVKRAIEEKVNKEVETLYGLGFRGADLLTACFGQAVSEFGKYEKVEKADGSEVTVVELLELAKTAAFNALLKGFEGDEYTKFYIGWLQMNGMGETDFDDAAKFTRIGMNIDVSDIFHHHLLIKDGNKQHLASYTERITGEVQGTNISDPLIDQVQQAMMLWSKENRPKLLRLIKLVGSEANNSFWRVLASLKELLPDGDDLKQVNELLANSEELIQSCQKDITGQATQMNLGF